MGRYRGCEPRPRIFWNSVRLALKQQVRNLATRARKRHQKTVLGKMVMRWAALGQNKKKGPGDGHRAGFREQGAGSHPPPQSLVSLTSVPSLPLLSRKECLVSSSGNDNTENGLPGSKAEEKPPTKV